VDLVTFTGGVAIGKYIAAKAGYRRIVLELGGNDPLIVMEDADLDKASDLAVQGSYKNSGQRCTAVKRMLVHEDVGERVHRARGREDASAGGMATLMDAGQRHGHGDRRGRRRAASNCAWTRRLPRARGCSIGNQREGALYAPTVLDRVRPEMTLVREETFGPVSPIIRFKDVDEAIAISNGTAYGLSSGICTDRMDYIARFATELEVGTVNLWEVPGYRIELTPFGGIKDSGLGYKEGVQEAIKSFCNGKTFTMPWG
jgi:acyl-CoA reductase-like NAD-dependent aldehyde dehydrogenase